MPNWKKVITSGSDASLNSLNATSAFTASGIIYPISDGSNNQSLVTDGAGNLTFGNPYSDNTVVYGKNLSGATIEKGTPLYFTGSGTTGNTVGVFPADASNPARMPAGGIAGEQMLNEAEGVVLLDGFINGVDTSAFDSGDLVYVGVGGGYTNVTPTGSSNLIQSLGYVEKIDNTNGSGVIKGPGVPRSVPNIQQGYVWVGNADDVPTPTPTSSLSVASATQTSQAITFNNGGTGAVSGTTFNGSTARTISYNTIGAQPLLTNPVTGTGTTNYLPKFTGTSSLGNSLVFDDGTNVGIGTTSPSRALHVSDSSDAPFRVESTDSTTGIQFKDPDGSNNIYYVGNGDYFYTSANVGIGTTNPGAKLDIVGPTNGDVILKLQRDGVSNFDFFVSDAGDGTSQLFQRANTTDTGFIFQTKNSSGNNINALTIAPSGNVGIGTTTPTETLDIRGSVKIGKDGTSPYLTFDEVPGDSSGSEFYLTHDISGNILKFTDDNSNDLIAMDRDNGRVGIGTTTPSEKLEVDGNVQIGLNSDAKLYMVSTGGNGNNERFFIEGYADGGTYGGGFKLHTRNDSNIFNPAVTVNRLGNVGIGTTIPIRPLTIQSSNSSYGTIRIYNDSATLGETSIGFFGTSTQNQNESWVIGEGGWSNSGDFVIGNENGGAGGNVRLLIQRDGSIQLPAYGAGFLTTDASGNVSVSAGSGTSSDTLDDVTGRGNTTTNSIEVGGLQVEDTIGIKRSGVNAITTLQQTGTGLTLNSPSGYHPFVIQHDGSELFRFSNSGNLGIGTISPSAVLDLRKDDDTVYDPTADDGQRGIGATIQLNNNSTTTNTFGQIMYDTDSSGQAVARIVFLDAGSASSAIAFVTENSETKAERMRIASNGNVGIGTDSPDNKLHLNVGGQTGGFKLIGNSSSYTAAFISNTGSGNAGIYFDAINGDISGNDYGFIGQNDSGYMLYNIGPSSPMPYHVLTGGNVGIGTTSPTAKLHVLGTSTGDATTKAEMLSNSVFSVRPHATNSGTLAIAQVDSGNSVGMQFTNGAGTSNWDISLQPFGGNVGIGTTSPSKKFSVDGGSIKLNNNNAAANYYLWLNKKEGWDGGILLQRDNNLDWQIANLNTSGDLNFYSYGGPASVMRIQRSTGNVGIGTTSPNYKLDVAGSINAGGKVTYTKAYSSLDTTGNAVAGLLASSNGASSLFTFTCHGDTGGYQKIVYSCHNAAGTWNTAKVIDEGTNDFDVTASANGSTITFTFKAASGTKGYSPKVTIEAIGSAINSTYA